MPLSSAQVLTLTKLLHADRDDWDLEGIRQHVEKLASDPRPWPVLQVQAITQAGVMVNRTPATILLSLELLAPVHRLPGVRPEVVPPCPEHGGVTLDDQGRYVCCKFDSGDPVLCENCGRCAGCHRGPNETSCDFASYVTCATGSCPPCYRRRPHPPPPAVAAMVAELKKGQR